jgi:hypothetical protein
MANSQSPQPGQPRTAAHNLVATYASVEQARGAIEALERGGVDASDISLLGEGMEKTAGPVTNKDQRDADLAVTGQVGKRAGSGVVIGAIIGALIGAVGGYLAHEMADIGRNVTVVMLGAAIGGALICAFAGGFYGGASGLPVSEAWGDTFEEVRGGQTCVAVHSDDAGAVDRAADALRGADAVKIVRFGRDGKRTQLT